MLMVRSSSTYKATTFDFELTEYLYKLIFLTNIYICFSFFFSVYKYVIWRVEIVFPLLILLQSSSVLWFADIFMIRG